MQRTFIVPGELLTAMQSNDCGCMLVVESSALEYGAGTRIMQLEHGAGKVQSYRSQMYAPYPSPELQSTQKVDRPRPSQACAVPLMVPSVTCTVPDEFVGA